MTFLAPWMLLGSLAASVPIILHFFYRAKYRPVPWGAMKFLKLSVEQTSRRLKFQEWLLLLLRVLAMLLLALALARPAFINRILSGGRGEAVDAVFLFDLSYSMNVKEGSTTRLDRAKTAALSVIENLPSASTVQILGITDRASVLGPKSPSNLDQARQLIQKLEVQHLASDLLPGFTEAINAFQRAEGGQKELYLFSDMQKLGWERQSGAIRSQCEAIKNLGTLYLVRCGDRVPKNAFIADIEAQGDIPHTGSRTAFTVTVKNSTNEPISKLSVTLEVDGKPLDKDAVAVEKLGAGEARAITLTGKITEPGWRVLTAKMQSDDLEIDNRLDRIILVRDQVRILVVDGAPNERNPDRSASFFLGHALMPIADALKPTYHIQPRLVRTQELSSSLLADREVCILVNVPMSGLSREFLERLTAWVKQGHGLFISTGSNVEPASYNRVMGPAPGFDLLPAELGQAFTAKDDNPLRLSSESIPLQSYLERFKESPLNQIANVEVLSGFETREPRDGARTLLKFTNGQPALLSRIIGEGEVLLLTTPMDPSGGLFPLHPSFMPFITSSLTHLVQRSAAPYNLVAGKTLRLIPPDGTKKYFLVPPVGERVKLGKPEGGAVDRAALTFTETTKAGIYQVFAEGSETATKFAVAPDLRDSDVFEAYTDAQIDEQLGFKPVHLTSTEDAAAYVGEERSRREWTIWILLILLFIAFGETALAWFCGRPAGGSSTSSSKKRGEV
jgi:hypothetical protein